MRALMRRWMSRPLPCPMRRPLPFWMRRSLVWAAVGIWVLVVLVWAVDGRSAFDIRAVEPRERGCGGVMALGPCGAPVAERLPREVTLYGFRPFGVGDIEFAAVSLRVETDSRVRTLELGCGRLEALTYTEEVWLVSAALASGGFVVTPTVRLGLVRLEDGLYDWALLADCRGSAALSDVVWVGAWLENPLGLDLRRSGLRLPTTLRASAGIRASEEISLGIDLSKANGFPTCLASGVEWRVFDGLWLRAGLRTCPREIALGVGARKGWVAIDVATSVSADLGATHEAGVRLLWR